MATTKNNSFTTDTLEVVWGHLHAPDDKFGADSANHNITVLVDEQLQMKLEELQQELGASKINGLRIDDEGRSLLKVKTKTFVKKEVKTFPCRDAAANKTEAVPFGGDSVRLRLAPAKLTMDDSMSLYLNGVQIIEKNMQDTGGFEATDGFDGSTFQAPEPEVSDSEEIPF